jgi:hypothetical protein
MSAERQSQLQANEIGASEASIPSPVFQPSVSGLTGTNNDSFNTTLAHVDDVLYWSLTIAAHPRPFTIHERPSGAAAG